MAFMTAPSREAAERIARDLVDSRLVACANVVSGVHSVYRWRGAVEEADEALTVLKFRAADLEAVGRRIQELHPYEVPEFVALRIEAGLPSYLNWIVEETSGGGAAG